jgi:hypothetical protein
MKLFGVTSLAQALAKEDSARLSGNITSTGTNQYTQQRKSRDNARASEQ